MGYFDALTDSSFKRGQDGRLTFYPWGVLGTGYILVGDEKYRKVRDSVKRYYLVSLPLVVVLGIVFGWLYAFVALPLILGTYAVAVRRVVSGLETSSERLTIGESYRNQAKGHSLTLLWVFEATSLLFVAIGVLALLTDRDAWSSGLAVVGFFGVCAVVF